MAVRAEVMGTQQLARLKLVGIIELTDAICSYIAIILELDSTRQTSRKVQPLNIDWRAKTHQLCIDERSDSLFPALAGSPVPHAI